MFAIMLRPFKTAMTARASFRDTEPEPYLLMASVMYVARVMYGSPSPPAISVWGLSELVNQAIKPTGAPTLLLPHGRSPVDHDHTRNSLLYRQRPSRRNSPRRSL